MCAARGKIISTLAVCIHRYFHPNFHQFVFQIDKTRVIRSSTPFIPPKFLWGENVKKKGYINTGISFQQSYDAKMKGETHFGKDENLPLRYAYFHVHLNIIPQNGSAPPVALHKIFHLWVSPSKGSAISEVPLRKLKGMMINDEMM